MDWNKGVRAEIGLELKSRLLPQQVSKEGATKYLEGDLSFQSGG